MSPVAEPIRVAVLNDYEVVALGLAAMLGDYPQRVRVVQVNVYLHVTEPVDLVLYDSFARTPSGVDIDLSLLRSNPCVSRSVLYTWDVTAHAAEGAAKGFSGVMSKSASAGRLVEALERVHAGEQVTLPAEPGDARDSQPAWNDWPGKAQGLSPRQSEIITHVVAGLDNKDIASSCYLSTSAVRSSIRAAYRTMGVRSRTQAVLWGIDHDFRNESRARFMLDGDDEASPCTRE